MTEEEAMKEGYALIEAENLAETLDKHIKRRRAELKADCPHPSKSLYYAQRTFTLDNNYSYFGQTTHLVHDKTCLCCGAVLDTMFPPGYPREGKETRWKEFLTSLTTGAST